MAEFSMPWNNIAVGDGQNYTWDEWHTMLGILLNRRVADAGVVRNYQNELACTSGAVNTVSLNTGAALVNGRFYENTVSKDITVASTSTGYIVAQLVNATQTIRGLTIAVGAEVQTDGVQWDIILYGWSTDGAGNVTLTDLRQYAKSPLADLSVVGAGDFYLIDSYFNSGAGVSPQRLYTVDTFTHLYLFVSDAGATIANLDPLSLRFNGDNGANYDDLGWYAFQGGITPIANYAQTSMSLGVYPSTGGFGTGVRGNSECWIMNYKDEDKFKNVFITNGAIYNAVAAVGNQRLYNLHGRWNSLNPIEYIDIYGNNYPNGALFSLYGVP